MEVVDHTAILDEKAVQGAVDSIVLSAGLAAVGRVKEMKQIVTCGLLCGLGIALAMRSYNEGRPRLAKMALDVAFVNVVQLLINGSNGSRLIRKAMGSAVDERWEPNNGECDCPVCTTMKESPASPGWNQNN